MLYAGIAQPSLPTFSAATAFYKAFKSITKKAEILECDRICAKVVEALGDKPLDTYTRDDANRLVKTWIEDGLSASSVQRYLNRLRAIVNTTRTEKTLTFPNVFEKLRIPKTPDRETKRVPFNDSELERIREGCRLADDERRWIIALLMDTGARLAEIVGLRRQDVVQTGDVPHIVIVNHEGRSTKTKQSERKIPLVGMALWGAERAMRAGNGEALFPSYVDAQGQTNADAASAALIKWLRGPVGISGAGKTLHSLRHAMRDRMRAAGVPEDVQNQLGGWAGSGSVGSRYGEWGLLKVLHEHMNKTSEVARE